MSEWLDDPDDVDIELPADYPKEKELEPGFTVESGAEMARKKAKYLFAEDRPEFLDEWDKIIPVPTAVQIPEATETIEVDPRDLRDAFDYCYRSVMRQFTVRMLDYLYDPESGPRERPARQRAWTSMSASMYDTPQQLFEHVLSNADFPETPFRTVESEEYEDINELYLDLIHSEQLIFVKGDQQYVAERDFMIFYRRECPELEWASPIPEGLD